MQQKIPPLLAQKARHPDVKLALLLDFEGDPGGCENCGGCGFISIFLATNGPFETPGSPSKFVSKFHDNMWWCAPAANSEDKEKTYLKFGTQSATCPVCNGIKRRGKLMTQIPMNPIMDLAEGMRK